MGAFVSAPTEQKHTCVFVYALWGQRGRVGCSQLYRKQDPSRMRKQVTPSPELKGELSFVKIKHGETPSHRK